MNNESLVIQDMENPRHELYTTDTAPGGASNRGYMEVRCEMWRKTRKVGVTEIHFNNDVIQSDIVREDITLNGVTRYDGGTSIYWNDNNFYIIDFTVTMDVLATGCITIGFRQTDDARMSVANRFRGANCWNFTPTSELTGNIKCETLDDVKPENTPNDKYDGFMISGFDYIPANTNIKIKALMQMPLHSGTAVNPTMSIATWDDYTAATVPLGIREEVIQAVDIASMAVQRKAYEYYDVPLQYNFAEVLREN